MYIYLSLDVNGIDTDHNHLCQKKMRRTSLKSPGCLCILGGDVSSGHTAPAWPHIHHIHHMNQAYWVTKYKYREKEVVQAQVQEPQLYI